MIVFGAKDFVDDVAVVRQEDETFGVLVQPPDRKDAFGMPDKSDDVVFDMGFGGGGDSHRFVEGDVDLLFLCTDEFAVDAYFVAVGNLSAQCGDLTVAGDAT